MNSAFVSIRTLTADQREFVQQVKKFREIKGESFSNIRPLRNGMLGAVKGKTKEGHIKFEYVGHWDDAEYISKWRQATMNTFLRFERSVKDEQEEKGNQQTDYQESAA